MFASLSSRGFRPCVYLGGGGDSVRLLGLRNGRGKRCFDPFDSFARTEYRGGRCGGCGGWVGGWGSLSLSFFLVAELALLSIHISTYLLLC